MRAARPVIQVKHLAAVALALSFSVLDWSEYKSRMTGDDSQMIWAHLHRGLIAPFQYRIGEWFLAGVLHRAMGLKVHNLFTVIDLFCILLSFLLLFRAVDGFIDDLPVAAGILLWPCFFFLAAYYLSWGLWFQRSGTMVSVVYACSARTLITQIMKGRRWPGAIALVVLSYLQGFVRADVAVILPAVVALGAVTFERDLRKAKTNYFLAATALLSAVTAGCVQLYLMWVKFPHTPYANGGAFNLLENLRAPWVFLVLLLGLFPFWLLLYAAARRSIILAGVSKLVLGAALVYLFIWAGVGSLGEVRIFLPFGVALLPESSLALASIFSGRALIAGAAQLSG